MKRGDRFYHKHWLDPREMPRKEPALMEVTKVTKTAIYYAPVYTYGEGPYQREVLSRNREWATPERFQSHCLLRWA